MIKIATFFLLFVSQIFAQNRLEVFFDFNKSHFNVKSKIKLDSLVKINDSLKIIKIEGYCDKLGSHKYNNLLSLKRAKSVINYFKNKNVNFANEFKTIAFGKNFEQNIDQSKNRKVNIYYYKNDIEQSKNKKVNFSSDKNDIEQSKNKKGNFSSDENDIEQPKNKKGKNSFLENDLKHTIDNAKKGDFIKLKNINFVNNSDEILPKSMRTLIELHKVLQDNEFLSIEIQGHICCKTPLEKDLISEARAKAIYNFLVKNKIDKSRLQYKGFGVSKPIFEIPEKNELEQEQNRRVEILILDN